MKCGARASLVGNSSEFGALPTAPSESSFAVAGISKDWRIRHHFLNSALVLVRVDHGAPELDGSLRRGRLTSSPPQFGQTKFICSVQLAQYVHS